MSEGVACRKIGPSACRPRRLTKATDVRRNARSDALSCSCPRTPELGETKEELMAFCTQCGATLADGVQFCVKCGARQQGHSSAPAIPAPTAASPAQSQGRSLIKILVLVLGIFTLMILLVVAGSVYVGYRVKRKAEQLSAEVKKQWEQAQSEKQPSAQSQPLGPTAAQTQGASQGEQVSSEQSCPALDAVQSQAFQAA